MQVNKVKSEQRKLLNVLLCNVHNTVFQKAYNVNRPKSWRITTENAKLFHLDCSYANKYNICISWMFSYTIIRSLLANNMYNNRYLRMFWQSRLLTVSVSRNVHSEIQVILCNEKISFTGQNNVVSNSKIAQNCKIAMRASQNCNPRTPLSLLLWLISRGC